MALTDTSAAKALDWHWLILAGIVGLYLMLAYLIPPGADTLWRLHIARGLLDGQVLYRDLIEVNPPLWFWGAIPAAAMGGYAALVTINLIAGLAGAALFAALVRLTLPSAAAAWAAGLGLAAGSLLVSVGEIGQREQAFLLASALWSAMVAARMEGKSIPVWLAIVATAFAAYGFALKHYFVLVPIILEALLLWHSKRAWRPFRVETVLLAALAGLYAAAVVYLTPDFLGRVLGLVQIAYYGFGPWNSVGPVERQARLILQCAFVIAPITAWVLARDKGTLVRVLLVALSTALVVVVLQQKGWRYHLIAANGLSIVVLSLLWQRMDPAVATRIAKRFVPLGLAAIGWTAILQPALSNLKTNGQPMDGVLVDLIANEPRDHHIAILSTAPDNAFFPMARAGRAHWSRHYSMWMMPGLLTPTATPAKEALRLAESARVLAEFTADLTCTPPNLIVGEVGYFRNPDPKLFDAMAFLQQDSAFAAWLNAHYRSQGNVENYPIWRLVGAKPAPANCSKQP